MARVDDLVGQVRDERLRRELESAVAELKKRQRFGLVYEEHLPETTLLDGLPIEPGMEVQKRDDLTGRERWRVCEVEGDTAQIEPMHGGAMQTAALSSLLTVRRFGEPIYPALKLLGETRRGEASQPSHAVINGENFHALQLLLYLYEGQADCIYLDPPYNTGARDWKYNNHYVDSSDTWRHSKWLSFMAKRLRLARRLLKPDGVLIITIDEHEVHHLGMLLEDLFREAFRQMVTIIINPKGVTQERFSRVDEYAFFCFFGNSVAVGRGDDLLTPGADDEEQMPLDDVIRRPRWKGLLRSGADSRREDVKSMFYPILIDPQRRAVVGAGDMLPIGEEPDFDAKIDGYSVAWPVRTDKTLGRWSVGNITLRQIISKGYVSVGGYDAKRKTWALSYLSREPQDQIVSGVLEVASYDAVKNVVDVQYTDVTSRRLKTVWHRSRHDAGVGGTDVITQILGKPEQFSYAKSVYAVKDCLAAVTRDRPNALIIDVFAGSGTTYHATCLLNAETEGQRRSILVTNNEVDADNAARLHRFGFYRGSAEYEQNGIFEQATRPRCEAVTTGVRPDGTKIPGNHAGGGRPFASGFPENVAFFKLEYLDADAVDLNLQFWNIAPALWLAAGGVGPLPTPTEDASGFFLPPACPFGVLFSESRFRAFSDALRARPEVRHVWLVTDSETAFAEMRAALPAGLHIGMLYRDYLRNFRINTERNLA